MVTLLLILALLIAVIAVIFALQNTMTVSVAFFVWQFEQSLALVLLLTVLLGVLIGLLTILPTVVRSKWQLSSKRKKLDALEKEVQALKIKLEDAERRLAPAVPADPVPDEPALPPQTTATENP